MKLRRLAVPDRRCSELLVDRKKKGMEGWMKGESERWREAEREKGVEV